MSVRLRQLATAAAETFWLLPALLVVAGILLAVALVELDRSGAVSQQLLNSPWLYNGGGTGARTLLGAVASSTIGVAGTVFSITIAALSLAAGQMGPRLLRNFVHDRGNQFTLGIFLGTFSYALMGRCQSNAAHSDAGEFLPAQPPDRRLSEMVSRTKPDRFASTDSPITLPCPVALTMPTYIITTRRITSGEELNRRNGEGGRARERRDMHACYQPASGPATLV